MGIRKISEGLAVAFIRKQLANGKGVEIPSLGIVVKSGNETWQEKVKRLNGEKCWNCEKSLIELETIFVSNGELKVYFCSQECEMEDMKKTDFSNAVA